MNNFINSILIGELENLTVFYLNFIDISEILIFLIVN
jgi:hypothetical protein